MIQIFSLLLLLASAVPAFASTDKYRLIWNDSPDSSITIGWCEIDGGSASLFYKEVESAAASQTASIDHKTSHLGLENRFVRLKNLKADTLYEFIIKDENSQSQRLTFKTAPDSPASFSFVAGGDSRNHRDARQRANRTAAKLRPLFVCFGGDMINRPTPEEWGNWLDDWQLTTRKDGHMIPIIAARGNHESAKDIHAIFDTPIPDDYYAVDFGNGFLRVYTLNSNITRGGSQGRWLESDLKRNQETTWKIAHYHHPFRPHTSAKTEQHVQYNAWAPLFFKFGIDLAIECDSHVVKRTWPVRPSNQPGSDQGFIRDDANGTTFIGEGCWGAPLRANDDDKTWTRASGSFNQINWLCVSPKMMFTRTIKVDSIEGVTGEIDAKNPFDLPEGLEIWEPETGAVVYLMPRGKDGRPAFDPSFLARLNIVADLSNGRISIEKEGEISEGVKIRYTSDGTNPTATSPVYTEPIEGGEESNIRAAIFKDGQAVTEVFGS